MDAETAKRLADIRAQSEMWSATMDTSTWETHFLLRLLDEKEKELSQLRENARSKV